MASTNNEYFIARDGPKRQIKPPQMHEEFAAFAFIMAESIDE